MFTALRDPKQDVRAAALGLENVNVTYQSFSVMDRYRSFLKESLNISIATMVGWVGDPVFG
jgi:hypothetical protein